MNPVLSAVSEALAGIASNTTWTMFVALAAVGTIAMAILELVKELTPARFIFQERWIGNWIEKRVNAFTQWNLIQDAKGSGAERTREARRQIVELSTGDTENALYDLRIEELTNQINLGAQVTLDDPQHYGTALVVLSYGSPIEDLKLVIGGQPIEGSTHPYFDARTRVARRIQRNLDGIRISCGGRWKFLMQMSSIVLTIAVVEYAVYTYQKELPTAALVALPIAIIGSYFAPITRDILAAVQKLRKM